MDLVTFAECERIGGGMLRKTGRTKALIGSAGGAAEYLVMLLREEGKADEDAAISGSGAVYPYGLECSETVWVWRGD